MLKNILLSGLLSVSIYAESFDSFLQRAIANSPYLKSSALGVEQARKEGSAIKRYKNPSLKLEYSRFKPDSGSRDNGFRAAYAQPVLLWGVGEDKERLSDATVQGATTSYTQKRAAFIRDLSIFYTLYSEQNMLLQLGDEELEIAKKIYEISTARYNAGTISRGMMLQSQIAYEMIQIRNESLGLAAMQSYYALLQHAGIDQEIKLEAEHEFLLNKATDDPQNPDVLTLHSAQKKALSQAAVNSNAIEWMGLYAEYENEPRQDIARVGVNIPLAFFNNRSQEKLIARLEADKSELLMQNKKTQLALEENRLQKQRQRLSHLKEQNEKVLKTEVELLQMFAEGYEIANINLLELQDIKNKVVETKERLIQIKTALNQNAITANYMQGNYNE